MLGRIDGDERGIKKRDGKRVTTDQVAVLERARTHDIHPFVVNDGEDQA